LDCNKKFENENDEDWSRVPVSQGFFKCAKLKTDDSDTFLVDINLINTRIFLKTK